MTVALRIPTMTSTTWMDGQRHRIILMCRLQHILATEEPFLSGTLNTWAPLTEIKWREQPDLAEDHPAFCWGCAREWIITRKWKGQVTRNYSCSTKEWGLHLLSNKETNFVSTEITQTDQHLENYRNRWETLRQEGRIKYGDQAKLWTRGWRRYRLIGLSSPCGVGEESRWSKTH